MRKIIYFPYLFCLIPIFFAGFTAQSQNLIAKGEAVYEGITYLEVRGGFCKVEIKAGSTSKIDFYGEITGRSTNEEEYKIKQERSGSTLKVWIERPKTTNWSTWTNLNGKLNFGVPANLEVFVDNNSGSVSADGLQSKKLHLEANSGSVSANNIQADSYFKANSGSLKIENHCGNLRAKTNSGSQKFRNIQGHIETESNSGSIRGEKVKITADSYFKTNSGGIKMDLKNDLKDLSFDLTAGSGSLHVGENRSGKRYMVKDGKIMITGISSSGSQKYGQVL